MSGGHMTPCSTCKHRTKDQYGYRACALTRREEHHYSPVSGPAVTVHYTRLDIASDACGGLKHVPTFWVALKTWLKELRHG